MKMSTRSLARKLKKFLEEQEDNTINHHHLLSASDLRKLNQNYQQQYDGISQSEVINKFMKHLSCHLESKLSSEGYLNNPNTPQELLTNLARLGTFSLVIYQGYLPDSCKDQIQDEIKDYLIELFKLKNFNGLRLKLKPEKTSLTYMIGLYWKTSNSNKTTIKRRVKSTTDEVPIPFEISYPAIYNPKCPEVGDQIRFDLEQNLKEIRSDLRRQAHEHQKHRHRRHRSTRLKKNLRQPQANDSPEDQPFSQIVEQEDQPLSPRVQIVSDCFNWDQQDYSPNDLLSVDTETEDEFSEEVDMS